MKQEQKKNNEGRYNCVFL
ncbi:BnaC09g32150D [Brassica napus]|uniref:BnaC09g32150D protein n=1 Tax=Brassica napus TaxID=3708 RepID=A0A078I955_BRANA|nr:BnaC09g32150D [Brassica napus]